MEGSGLPDQPGGTYTFTPKEKGTIFLVVDFTIYFKGLEEREFGLLAIAHLEEDDALFPVVFGLNFPATDPWHYGSFPGALQEGNTEQLEESMISLKPAIAKGAPFNTRLVFTIPQANADKEYKLYFPDMPGAIFLVKAGA